MIEKQVTYTISNEKVIERLVEDDNLGINHMILRESEALPVHYTNSNVYMIVIRGKATLKLDDQEPHAYPSGSIILIPYKTKMDVSNRNGDALEIFVIKAPSPLRMG